MLTRTAVVVACALLLQASLAQQVIDTSRALMEAMTSGGAYELAPGNYWIDVSVVSGSDLTLMGSGAGDTVLLLMVGRVAMRHVAGTLELRDLTLAYSATAPGDILHVAGGTARLERVVLAGARVGVETGGAKPFGWGSAIVAWGSAEVHLAETEIRGSGLAGVELYDRATLQLQAGVVQQNSVGVYAEDQARVGVTDTLFLDNKSGAYRAQGQVQSVIEGSRFVSNGVADETTGAEADGLRFGGTTFSRLTGNHFEANPRFAISAWGSASVEASHNVFVGNGGEYEELNTYASAVVMEESSTLTMHGDSFTGNPGGALELGDNATARLSEVHMEGNGSWAFLYTGDHTRLWISRSTFEGNHGAMFVAGTGDFMLTDSTVSGSGDDGLILAGSIAARIENSVIAGNLGVGVALYDGVQVRLSHNVVRGNRSGIVLYQGSGALLEQNRLLDNERSGLAAFDTSAVEMRDNELASNGYNGVHVDDDAHAVVERNMLRGNARVGVGFSGRSTGLVTGNHIATSAVAVALGPDAHAELADNEFEDNGEDVRNVP